MNLELRARARIAALAAALPCSRRAAAADIRPRRPGSSVAGTPGVSHAAPELEALLPGRVAGVRLARGEHDRREASSAPEPASAGR